jgi:hypothetical protein
MPESASLLRFNETDRAPIAYFQSGGSLSFDLPTAVVGPVLLVPLDGAGMAIMEFD